MEVGRCELDLKKLRLGPDPGPTIPIGRRGSSRRKSLDAVVEIVTKVGCSYCILCNMVVYQFRPRRHLQKEHYLIHFTTRHK